MRNTRSIPHNWICLLFFVAIFSLTASNASSQGKDTSSIRLSLLNKGKTFIAYNGDFSSFRKSTRDSLLEHSITVDFGTIGSRTVDRIFAIVDMLEIYDEITGKADRARVKSLLESKLKAHADNIDEDIEMVNINLGGTRMPAIAESGTRMKDDLRSLKSFLYSTKL